jgi:DNA (cytosine-5)-methyltransferase 1
VIDDEGEDDPGQGDRLPDKQDLRDFLGLNGEIDDAESSAKYVAPAGRSKTRNTPLNYPWEVVDSIDFGQSKIRAGKSVELKPYERERLRPQILTISCVYQHKTKKQVRLYGVPLFRNSRAGEFPHQPNEVHMVLEEDEDDQRPLFEQAMVCYDLEEVVKLRHIKFTQLDFPALSFRTHTPLSKRQMTREVFEHQKAHIKNECELVCRYIRIKRFASAADRLNDKKHNQRYSEARRLLEGEDPSRNIPVELKRCDSKKRVVRNSPQKPITNTYSSAFCGLGGDALGAKRVGFNIVASFDLDEKACLTFQLNHDTRTVNYMASAETMIGLPDDAIPFSDVWHFSPPCQPWSPAHTRAGKNDWKNTLALFSIEPFLKKTKPLIATLEQTAGLNSHHPEYLAFVLNQYMSAGYNVRWQITNFYDHGLASSRSRLVLMAAVIGHPIPDFPEISHGTEPGLLPYNTIGNAIARIPRHADWHLGSVNDYPTPKAPSSPDRRAACITTGENPPHPNGQRPMTIRELAALNGFPSDFKFPSTTEVNAGDLRRQIGNAVPPLVWEKYMRKVDQCLTNFRNGKINEAGNPIPLQEVSGNINGMVNNMRDISLEPLAPAPRPKPVRRQRPSSKTLSPDPPRISYSTLSSGLEPGSCSSTTLKRKDVVNLCGDAETINDTTRPQKKTRTQDVVDLTGES